MHSHMLIIIKLKGLAQLRQNQYLIDLYYPENKQIKIYICQMSSQKRAPAEATFKVDPSVDIHKTLYPYLNYKQGGLTPYADSFKRTIASFNPFAVQQVPTSDRLAVGMKQGSRWYFPDAYPNTIHFDQHWPSHYNPFADTRRQYHYGVKYATKAGDQLGFSLQPLPRFCQRTIATYKRCLVANNDNQSSCIQEQDNIIGICPNFALDSLKRKNLQHLKLEALNNLKYKRATQVSEYNAGRTVANVPRKTWVDGTADKLRPDSMWIDDRYVDISQSQIDQAKQRVRARDAAKGKSHHDEVHLQLYDRTFTKPAEGIPLYP